MRLVSDPRLRRLELSISGKLGAGGQGNVAGIGGVGFEPDDARVYVPGDDLRRIDWMATARSSDTYVRPAIGDHEMVCYLVIDASAPMNFGTGQMTKLEIAEAATVVFGMLTGGRGGRVGGLVTTGNDLGWFAPSNGLAQVRRMLKGFETPAAHGSADLGSTFTKIGHMARRRGLIVVVSDFLEPAESWARQLSALGMRHELITVVISDRREREVFATGPICVREPRTGEVYTLEVDERAAEKYRIESRRQQRARRAALKKSRARIVALDTRRNPTERLINWVLREQQLASRGAKRR